MSRTEPHTADLPDSPDLADIDVLTVLQALSDPVRLEIVRQLAACCEPALRQTSS